MEPKDQDGWVGPEGGGSGGVRAGGRRPSARGPLTVEAGPLREDSEGENLAREKQRRTFNPTEPGSMVPRRRSSIGTQSEAVDLPLGRRRWQPAVTGSRYRRARINRRPPRARSCSSGPRPHHLNTPRVHPQHGDAPIHSTPYLWKVPRVNVKLVLDRTISYNTHINECFMNVSIVVVSRSETGR